MHTPPGGRGPGTYALVLCAPHEADVVVGRLGKLHVRPGYYVYVGSALGPGGLAARLRHHLTPARTPHWHIDYLRRAVAIERIWYAIGGARQEHAWARVLEHTPGSILPMPGFGASDCACAAHLFYFESAPSFSYLVTNVAAYTPDVRCSPDNAPPEETQHETGITL